MLWEEINSVEVSYFAYFILLILVLLSSPVYDDGVTTQPQTIPVPPPCTPPPNTHTDTRARAFPDECPRDILVALSGRVFPTIKNYRTVNFRYHGRVTFIFGATYVKWSDLAYKDGCKLSDNPAFGNDRLPLALEAVVCIPEFRYCSQVPCYRLTVGERLGLDCLH